MVNITTMKYHRKLKQLSKVYPIAETYSKRLRTAKIRKLFMNPQQLLANYLQANGQI